MKNIDIKNLINGLQHLENRLVDSYNNSDIIFRQYEEDRLDVGNAIELIQNQQAEIERLKKEKEVSNSNLAKAINKSLEQAKEIGDLKAECVKVNLACVGMKKLYTKAKTEAYKEFAELSKERLTGWDTDPTDEEIEDTLDDVLQELTERKED